MAVENTIDWPAVVEIFHHTFLHAAVAGGYAMYLNMFERNRYAF